jgi:[acyl-carrier-protein] S-malonyltransferase
VGPARPADRGLVPIAFVFPGQGSQKAGMGAELKTERPQLFERYLTLADEVSGMPISRYCLEGPIEDLTRTEVAQPALFAVGLAVADAAAELGLAPDYVAGHSLGEYTAAVVAGALSAEDGMRVVCERGRLMAAIQSERPGAMAAIIGLPQERLEALCEQASAEGTVTVANLNSPTQIVVSGEEAGVVALLALAEEAQAKRAIRLQVGAAFHSELMVPVYERLTQTIDEVSLTDPTTPLVAIYSAEVLASAEQVREALLRQIISPVRWVEVVRALVGAGCQTFLELGPGRVLIGLIRQIHPDATMAAADSVEKLQEFAATGS